MFPAPWLEAHLRQQVRPIFQRGHDDALEAADPFIELLQRRFLRCRAADGFGLFNFLLDVGVFQGLQVGLFGGKARQRIAHRRQFSRNGRVFLGVGVEDIRAIEEGGLRFAEVLSRFRGRSKP